MLQYYINFETETISFYKLDGTFLDEGNLQYFVNLTNIALEGFEGLIPIKYYNIWDNSEIE